MAIEPFFGRHPMALSLQCRHAIKWQPKVFDRQTNLDNQTQRHFVHMMVTKGN